MIVAVIGYIGTMVAAFVALVVAWKAVLGPHQMEKVHLQPPVAIGAVGRQAAPPKQPGEWGPPVVHKAANGADTASTDAAQAAAEKDAAAKAKRLQQARYQKRKAQIARQQQDQQYSTALGYDQERSYEQQRGRAFSPGPMFNVFTSSRY